MDTRITLELSPGEAILTLEALNKQSAEAFRVWRRLLNTHAPADEQDCAKLNASVLSRVSAGLSRSLYPSCDWPEECEASVVGSIGDGYYCRRHMAQLQAQFGVALA